MFIQNLFYEHQRILINHCFPIKFITDMDINTKSFTLNWSLYEYFRHRLYMFLECLKISLNLNTNKFIVIYYTTYYRTARGSAREGWVEADGPKTELGSIRDYEGPGPQPSEYNCGPVPRPGPWPGPGPGPRP